MIVPSYRYRVTVGSEEMAFNAVSGLELSVETLEYKDGTGGVFRMPGQQSAMNISLKRGVMLGSTRLLFDWFQSALRGQGDKKDISVSLTDETGSALLVTWSITNAFPTKLTAPSFDATSNEVAIEELCLTADGMTIQFH